MLLGLPFADVFFAVFVVVVCLFVCLPVCCLIVCSNACLFFCGEFVIVVQVCCWRCAMCSPSEADRCILDLAASDCNRREDRGDGRRKSAMLASTLRMVALPEQSPDFILATETVLKRPQQLWAISLEKSFWTSETLGYI